MPLREESNEDVPCSLSWLRILGVVEAPGNTATQKARDTEDVAAWVRWGEKNAASIVENGPPLGKTKRVDRQGITDVTNELTG
jgi:hypothetical protein